MNDMTLLRLNEICTWCIDISNGTFKIEAFGSSVNEFGLVGSSDIDVAINFYNKPYIDWESILWLIWE